MPTVTQHILSAVERRDAFMREARAQGTNCFRLFSGEGEGVPGLVLELWNDVLVAQTFEKLFKHEAELPEALETLQKELSLKQVFRKDFLQNRNKGLTPAGEDSFEVTENGLKFEVRPEEPFSVGLFLDQRDNRKRVGELARGRRVLNLFSYTCGFSLYALKGGARSVVSVDLSAKYLEWGKKNFEKNELSVEEKARWFCGDAFDVLKRLKKKDEKFELLVLDPPTFSRGAKGAVFKIARDLPQLWEACAEVLEPGAIAFLSSNYTGFRNFGEGVKLMVDDRFGKALKLPPIPQDFSRETEKLHTSLIELNWL